MHLYHMQAFTLFCKERSDKNTFTVHVKLCVFVCVCVQNMSAQDGQTVGSQLSCEPLVRQCELPFVTGNERQKNK